MAESTAKAVSTNSLPSALLRTARPRQWLKNLLVFAAPMLSGGLTEPRVLALSLVTFALFCCAASGIYFVNDAQDVGFDRAHPTKRLRPVAAGLVPVRTAYLCGAALLAGALIAAVPVSVPLLIAVATYVGVSLLYCFFLKHEPVLDIAIVAAGFLIRAIAGGVASGIELSQWFLLAASFGSLFVASGKRYAEARMDHEDRASFRRSLAGYTSTYLRFVWTLSAGVLIMTYGLWAFELDSDWAVLSMAPFVLGVLRYAVTVDAGKAGEPEDIAWRDRVLQGLALIWLVCVVLHVYHR